MVKPEKLGHLHLVYHFIRMKGWVKEPPSGFEHGSPGFGIQHVNHKWPLLHYTVKPLPLPFRKFAFGEESPPASQQNTTTPEEGVAHYLLQYYDGGWFLNLNLLDRNFPLNQYIVASYR